MKMSEMIEYTLMQSGQFIISPTYALTEFMMNHDAFFILARHEIEIYYKYIPFTWNKTLFVSKTHTFEQVLSEPTVPPTTQHLVEQIPEWISSVTPVELYSAPAIALLFKGMSVSQNGMNGADPRPAATWIWRYEKPKLLMPYQGNVDVMMHGRYLFVEDRATGGKLRDVEWPGLDYDSDLLDLIAAKFMMSLGRSRRAFLLTDIPVQVDTDNLVTEGKEMYDVALQQIRDRAHTHLSIGN